MSISHRHISMKLKQYACRVQEPLENKSHFCKFSSKVKDFSLNTTRAIVWKHENTIMAMFS